MKVEELEETTEALSNKIKVIVKLFAVFQEVIRRPEICLELANGSTVNDALELLLQDHPSLAKWRSHLRSAINLEFVSLDHQLNDGDEVAFIPPVSGG
jgi:sulfur-carrier protein